MKKLINKTLNKTLSVSKRAVTKNSRVKNYTKHILSQHIPPRLVVEEERYLSWVRNNYPDGVDIVRMKRESEGFSYRPLVSIVTPTYNTDENMLRECIESVQSQAYENWQLCLVDDASPNKNVKEIIKEYAANDERINYKFCEENKHIADASNAGIALAEGEFIGLLDHDDVLWPNALYEVVRALNDDKTLDFIYSDEDKVTENRRDYQSPFFKPDWNPDFLHSVNYITHFSVIRKLIIEKVGGFRREYNGAQDWDLFLRVSTQTDKIHHVPTVLYSWRISDNSTAKDTSAKPYVTEAQKKAIKEALGSQGYGGAEVSISKNHKDYWQVLYPVKGSPLVSIVIPTKNQYKIVKRCIDSIYAKTTYQNFEIILVDTGSTDKKVLNWYKQLHGQYSNIKFVKRLERPFSYARTCNYGAQQAGGEYLLMLNNDTEVITPNWIELMLGYAQREKTGAVGCKLYYPGREQIQHAGIGIGFGGVAANALATIKDSKHLTPMQHLYLNTTHNMSAVTAACMLIKKNAYDQVEGFDEKFSVTYNDVDLCLRLLDKGYRNVYLPNVSLIHHESISLGLPEETRKRDTTEFKEAKRLFKRRWKKYIDHDPNLNPNIDRLKADFDIYSVND